MVCQKNRKPVLILIMDAEEEPRASRRADVISTVLSERSIPHETVVIPPIASINWGRNVGYETNYINVDPRIQQISGTDIREKIRNGNHDWKQSVPHTAQDEVLGERY